MKIQRHFAPTGGRFQSESVARFIGICILLTKPISHHSEFSLTTKRKFCI
ncbi:MAG: hypothetical protein AB1410_08625 [Acidobacteriota bacterium]